MVFKKTVHLSTLEETKRFAQSLLKDCQLPVVVVLFGPLGIGKTQFVKFFAYFLGIKDVNSPSFVKMNIYSVGKQKLVHFDGYHLNKRSDLNQFFDYFDVDYLLLEWPENVVHHFDFRQTISLFWSWGRDNQRIVTVESYYKILNSFRG